MAAMIEPEIDESTEVEHGKPPMLVLIEGPTAWASSSMILYHLQHCHEASGKNLKLLLHQNAAPSRIAAVKLPHRHQLVVPAMDPTPFTAERHDLVVPEDGCETEALWWASASPPTLGAVVLEANDDGTVADHAVLIAPTDLGVAFNEVPEFVDELVAAGRKSVAASAAENGVALLLPMFVLNWRDTLFADRIRQLIAAVGVGDAHGYDTPTDLFPAGPERKVRRTSAFRKGAARGRYTRVRIIDLAPATTTKTTPTTNPPAARSAPTSAAATGDANASGTATTGGTSPAGSAPPT